MRPTDRTGIAVILSVALACLTVRQLTEDGGFLALSWLLIGLIGGIGIAMRRARFGGTAGLAAQSAGLVLSAAGQAIAFIPNALGRALLHDEKVSR